jgi:hypothetical protein
MRGRKLSYDPAGWDEPIWEVVFADAENKVVCFGLTAGEAMRLANETNVTARRRGGRIVAVRECSQSAR